MSTYNTNNKGANNNNPYGHLLDKYLDSNHVDWETRQQREKESKERYGNLLDKAKPDLSTLNLMAKMEDDRIDRRKQMEEERRLGALRNQERIEAERRKEEEHKEKVRSYGESLLEAKREKIKAEEAAKEEKRKAEEKQQEMYGQIEGLMRINPELAEFYVQTMKKYELV